MKNMKILFFVFLTACTGSGNQSAKVVQEDPDQSKVTIYYFHLTNRCPTCKSVEVNIIATLDNYFLKEKGEISLKIVNVEEPANKDSA